MSTAFWTGADAGEAEPRIWMLRDGFVDLVQGRFLPFLGLVDVATLVDEALAAGLGGTVLGGDGAIFIAPEPALRDFFGKRPDLPDAADLAFCGRQASAARPHGDPEASPRRYRISQTVEVAPTGLPDVAALHLWLPGPLHVPGVQEVRLGAADPPGLAEAWLPEAGQFYNVPFLLDPRVPEPRMTMSFEVSQRPADLHRRPDGAPPWRRMPLEPGAAEALDAWVQARLGSEPKRKAASSAVVDALWRAVEDDFAVRFHAQADADPVARALASRSGDVAALTDLLARALNRLGLGAWAGRGLAVPLDDGRACLGFPTGTGYHHAFLDWQDPESGDGGSVDLNPLLRRTRGNGGESASVGPSGGAAEASRTVRDSAFILAGRPMRSQIRLLQTGQSYTLPAPVRTVIEIEEQ